MQVHQELHHTLPSGNWRAGVVFNDFSSAPTRQRSVSNAEMWSCTHPQGSGTLGIVL